MSGFSGSLQRRAATTGAFAAFAALTLFGAPAALAQAGSADAGATPVAAAAAASSGARESGRLAWYGKRFAGRRTASGERFNPGALTMAHRTLAFGTRVKLTNAANGRSVVVRVNDRGPTQTDRIGDVSREGARRLGMLRNGLADVELEVIGRN